MKACRYPAFCAAETCQFPTVNLRLNRFYHCAVGMPRQEHDKEDLITDAVALINRVEYSVYSDGLTSPQIVTAGFRSDHCLSVYFDQDPFYQFDLSGLLRRSYADGLLFRSQGDTLAKIKRQRSDGQVTLLRTDLTSTELQDFRASMQLRLQLLKNAIQSKTAVRLRSVTEMPNFDTTLTKQIDAILGHNKKNFLSATINHRK